MKAAADSKKTAAPAAEAAATTVLEGSEMGEVKIHENVIASLVRRAALSIEGVSRLAGSTLVDNIAEIVGSRRMQARAITVDMAENNRVSVEIKLNIKAGEPRRAASSAGWGGCAVSTPAATGGGLKHEFCRMGRSGVLAAVVEQ